MRRDDFAVSSRGPVNRRYPIYADANLANPVVVSGWTATAQVRSPHTNELLYSFACVVETNAVRITAPQNDVAGWAAWPLLVGAWDLALTDPSGTKYAPPVGGVITVKPVVTLA